MIALDWLVPIHSPNLTACISRRKPQSSPNCLHREGYLPLHIESLFGSSTISEGLHLLTSLEKQVLSTAAAYFCRNDILEARQSSWLFSLSVWKSTRASIETFLASFSLDTLHGVCIIEILHLGCFFFFGNRYTSSAFCERLISSGRIEVQLMLCQSLFVQELSTNIDT
jgi:hypothetical protein